MDKKTLERINTLLADRTPVRDSEQDNAPSSHSGLGLRNVDERIKLYFGPEYGLEYESEEDVGTLARIRLPIVEGDLE
jgi:two-component system sensor histidine kinase YesM